MKYHFTDVTLGLERTRQVNVTFVPSLRITSRKAFLDEEEPVTIRVPEVTPVTYDEDVDEVDDGEAV